MKRMPNGMLLMIGLLLSAPCVFAADGDLTVNGKLVAPGVIAQVFSVSPTTDISTASTSFVDMPGMSVTLTTTGNSTLLILWNAALSTTVASSWVVTEALVDNIRMGAVQGGSYSSSATTLNSIGGNAIANVAAGTHTVKLGGPIRDVCNFCNRQNSGNYMIDTTDLRQQRIKPESSFMVSLPAETSFDGLREDKGLHTGGCTVMGRYDPSVDDGCPATVALRQGGWQTLRTEHFPKLTKQGAKGARPYNGYDRLCPNTTTPMAS